MSIRYLHDLNDRRPAATFRSAAGLLLLIAAPFVLSGASPHVDSEVGTQPRYDTLSEAADPPRNVVFILSDDHRYDAMGFHENSQPFLETPHMDRMAREGAHVANAFVSTALCSPSRASILSGLYTHNHGITDNNTLFPDEIKTFPEHLQEAGYETAYVGKWHMGGHSDEPRPGFDRWVSYRGQGVYYDPTFNVDGERIEREGYISDLTTEYALDWLKQRDGEAPFMLYISHKAVHAGFRPAERHDGVYDDVELAYPETMYLEPPLDDRETPTSTDDYRESWPEWVRDQRSSWHGVDYMYHGRINYDTFYRNYHETILGIDESIGEVLDYLEANGLDDNTLVIYMGDNGFSFGEHGLIDKRHAFEESMRVPMLAWSPGFITPGRVVNEMIQNIDIAPTFLDLAGVSPSSSMDGRSFMPILAGDPTPWRDEILYEYYWEWNFPQTPTQFALRTDRYKYIFFHGLWDKMALFDLEADPKEKYNLIDHPDHQERVSDMRERLFEKLEETNGLDVPLLPPRGRQNDKRRPPDEPSTSPIG